MLSMMPVSGGQYRVLHDKTRQTHFIGSKTDAERTLARLQRAAKARPRYALRLTSYDRYIVIELPATGGKKVTKDCVRYETSRLKRAERILEAFNEGLI